MSHVGTGSLYRSLQTSNYFFPRRTQRMRRLPRRLQDGGYKRDPSASSDENMKTRRESIVTPSYRCSQFPGEFCVNSDMLFCLYCGHPVDYVHKNSAVEHIKSKKHIFNKGKCSTQSKVKNRRDLRSRSPEMPTLQPFEDASRETDGTEFLSRPQRVRRPPVYLQIRDQNSLLYKQPGICQQSKTQDSRCNPSNRCAQFPGEFTVNNGLLMCIYCNHAVDNVHKNAIVEHLKSNKHVSNKKKKLEQNELQLKAQEESSEVCDAIPKEEVDGTPLPEQPEMEQTEDVALACTSDSSSMSYDEFTKQSSIVSVNDTRNDSNVVSVAKDCVLSFTCAGIPLSKLDRLNPFLERHFAPNTPLPTYENLTSFWVPTFFQNHFNALCSYIANNKVSVIVDATTSKDNNGIMVNVLAGVADKTFMVDCVPLKMFTPSTYSQAILGALVKTGINFENIHAIVTDVTVPCQKAFNETLVTLFPNAVHVLCFKRILEQVQQVWIHSEFCSDMYRFLQLLNSVFKVDSLRKHRWLQYLKSKAINEEKLPPAFSSEDGLHWFEAVQYHSKYLDQYVDFFSMDVNESSSVALEELMVFIFDEIKYICLEIKLAVVSEVAKKMSFIINMIASSAGTPLATKIYNILEDFLIFLKEGIAKTTWISHVDKILNKFSPENKEEVVASFTYLFERSHQIYDAYFSAHPAREIYRACRIFDPRQVPSLPRDIFEYSILRNFQSENLAFNEEWLCYQNIVRNGDLKNPFDIAEYWEQLKTNLPNLYESARWYLWFPVSLICAEHSQSLYNSLLMDDSYPLTPDNVRYLTILNFNGDLSNLTENASV